MEAKKSISNIKRSIAEFESYAKSMCNSTEIQRKWVAQAIECNNLMLDYIVDLEENERNIEQIS